MIDYFVFIHIKIGVSMVVRKIEYIEGFENVYGPNSLDDCLRWITDHSSNNYWILENEQSKDITIMRGINEHGCWKHIHGPTSLDGCLVWIKDRINNSNIPDN